MSNVTILTGIVKDIFKVRKQTNQWKDLLEKQPEKVARRLADTFNLSDDLAASIVAGHTDGRYDLGQPEVFTVLSTLENFTHQGVEAQRKAVRILVTNTLPLFHKLNQGR